VAQTLASLWLIIGFAERTAVFIATSWILISIALVTWGNASMLIRRAGERSLLDRMRDHDLDLCANDCSKSTGFQTRRDLEMARSCNFTRGAWMGPPATGDQLRWIKKFLRHKQSVQPLVKNRNQRRRGTTYAVVRE